MKVYSKIHVVNYKETTIDDDNVMEVESGVCELGYTDEADAIAQVKSMVDNKFKELTDDLDSDEIEDNVSVEYNDNHDYGCITMNDSNSTYEYWVSDIDVENK